MTVREIIDCVIDGQPLTDDLVRECLFGIAGGLRTQAHREPSTFDGDCAGVLGWIDAFGPPTVENFERFRSENPGFLEMVVPDEVLVSWCAAKEEE